MEILEKNKYFELFEASCDSDSHNEVMIHLGLLHNAVGSVYMRLVQCK